MSERRADLAPPTATVAFRGIVCANTEAGGGVEKREKRLKGFNRRKRAKDKKKADVRFV